MTPLIKKAHRGNRDAMTTLYQLNKQQVYYICNLLLCDPKAADNACVHVFKNIWDYLLNGKIATEEEFTEFVIKKAVNHCKNKITKSNNKAFRIPQNKNFAATQYSVSTLIIEGDACEQVLANLPPLHRFIYVLSAYAKWSDADIAELLHTKSDVIKAALDAEQINLDRLTYAIKQKTTEEAGITTSEFHMLMGSGLYSVQISHAIDTVVILAIDSIAEPIERKAKQGGITMAAEKKKVYGNMRIIAIEGKDIFRADTLTALKNGKLNADRFGGIIDESLDTDKLCEVYKAHEAEMGYPYLADKKYCRAIVSVSFDLAVKQYEQYGRRFVRYGYSVSDADMQDHACVREVDGEPMLVAIEIPYEKDRSYAPVENPLSADILGKYFEYDAEKKEYKRSKKDIPSAVKCEEIREYLYTHGFDIDGIHYVRYKRSAGSSRDGRCLFIAEPLYQDMMAWSSCGLSTDSVSDQASWQAYIALTLSSIESAIRLPKKAILIIPDKVSRFTTKAVCVKEDATEGLTAEEEETEMLGYIGERQGSNGLFSDEGEKINLSAISREIDEHPGNVWGIIISLKREDAERLGYNSAEQWMNLLRSHRNDIAKEMHILPSNLRWYAAYHNKEKNPHVHIMVWSKEPREPFLSREGIHNLKQTFASDIFRQELTSIYKKQTEVRDDLKEKYKSTIAKVVAEIKNGDHAVSPELVMKMQLLSEKLQKHKGKKVYGYLDKSTKALVNEIVKMLGSDPQLSELYDAWYGYKCETVRTYTDIMPDKIPIEENEEFKSIRNAVVSAVRDIHTPPEQPDYAVDYDYSKLKEHANNFDYLYGYANRYEDPIGYYRLGRYYLEKTDDMENAEWWLRMAADNGNSLSAYLIYKAYRDGKFDETPSDMMKYLRKAADAGFGYAEYEYAKYLRDKSPEDAKEYLRRAAEHGCNQAEYAYGKMLFEEGRRDEARAYFERSAEDDEWTQTRVGLLLYYEYKDYDAGKEYIHKAAEAGYEPAKEAIRAINNNLNAQIVIGVCDLFYHASRIIKNEAEDMYAEEQHQVNYHGIDKKQRREIRAKKQAQGHSLSW